MVVKKDADNPRQNKMAQASDSTPLTNNPAVLNTVADINIKITPVTCRVYIGGLRFATSTISGLSVTLPVPAFVPPPVGIVRIIEPAGFRTQDRFN